MPRQPGQPSDAQLTKIREMNHNLTNHAPVDATIINAFEHIRVHAKEFASVIVLETPASREQSLALTNLEQAVMWAVAAIARHQDEILMQWMGH